MDRTCLHDRASHRAINLVVDRGSRISVSLLAFGPVVICRHNPLTKTITHSNKLITGLSDDSGTTVSNPTNALILERQREGIAMAKQRGTYTGRKPALSDEQARQLRERANAGEKKSLLVKEFGVSHETAYSYLPSDTPQALPNPVLCVVSA